MACHYREHHERNLFPAVGPKPARSLQQLDKNMPWISFWTLKLKPHQYSPKSPQTRNCNEFEWDNLYHNVMTLEYIWPESSCWTAGNPCWLAGSCAALGPPRWMSIGCLDVGGWMVGWLDGCVVCCIKGEAMLMQID